MSADEASPLTIDDASLRRAVAATLLPGFVGTTLPDWLARRLRGGLGGVCIFGPNITSRAQLRALTDAVYAANPLAVVAIDEEGGDVTRLYYEVGSPYPGNAVLGRLDDIAFTEHVAREVGWELRRAGCNLDFAPDVDINSNPDNPVIGARSFGSSPDLVARHSAAWTRGLQSAGIAASAKHFPGHGDTAQDSHLAMPIVDRSLDQLRERELVPFQAVVAAGARSVMTSHIMLPQLDRTSPATLSGSILRGLLRDELGFDGVIVSDALDMAGASGERGIPEASVGALAAGCDLLCLGTETTDDEVRAIEDAVVTAIATGRVDADAVRAASERVRALAAALADERTSIAVPGGESTPDEPVFDLDRVRSAIEVGPAVDDWVTAAETATIVQIDTAANIAVGIAPWGPFAVPGAFSGHGVHRLTEEVDDTTGIPAGTPVLVVGKAIHRYAFARAAIDRLRAANPVLVVDMGWPSDDRRYADVATFGSSRLMGAALLAELRSRVS